MDTEICHLGYSITLKTIPPHFLQNIKNDLYVKPIENPNFPSNETKFPVFRMSKNKNLADIMTNYEAEILIEMLKVI